MRQKIIIFLIIILVGLAAMPPSSVKAFINFGGRITFLNPTCASPPGVYVVIGPPKPGSFMYLPGTSRSYLFGPPKNTGQWMLGKASPTPVVCMVPCPTGLCPAGAGPLILFHGSSKF